MNTNKPLEIKPSFITRFVIGVSITLSLMSIACFAVACFKELETSNVEFFTWIGCALVLILILAAVLYSFRYSWVDMAKADRDKEIKTLHNRINELKEALDKKEQEIARSIEDVAIKASGKE